MLTYTKKLEAIDNTNYFCIISLYMHINLIKYIHIQHLRLTVNVTKDKYISCKKTDIYL